MIIIQEKVIACCRKMCYALSIGSFHLTNENLLIGEQTLTYCPFCRSYIEIGRDYTVTSREDENEKIKTESSR